MTTFWARMLIFNECNNGNLPKKVAQQFDSLLDMCEYITIHSKDSKEKKIIRLDSLNGHNINCVLGNIGAKRIESTNNYKFDVIKYIQSTVIDTVTDNEGGKRRDILTNIIGQEFVGLDYEIYLGLEKNIYTEEELRIIKRYLEDTYTITAEMDVSRNSRELIKKISEILKEEYIEFHHINDNIMGR